MNPKQAQQNIRPGQIQTVSQLDSMPESLRKKTWTTKKKQKKSMHYYPAYIAFVFTEAMIVYTYCMIVYSYQKGPFLLLYLARFRVFSAIVFGAMAIGEASSFTPDASKAAASAEKIFALIDQEPSIDSEKTDGLKLEQV